MLTELFCEIDDFCNSLPNDFFKSLPNGKKKQRQRAGKLSLSEVMTIMVLFHSSGFKHFKAFYCKSIFTYYNDAFQGLISYSRFVQKMPRALNALVLFLETKKGKSAGIAFADATALKVCHNKRIKRNKVFKELAEVGKSTMGWFFGFKLHLIINDRGELISYQLTKGNVDDRKPIPLLTKDLKGKLFADKGYISKTLSADLMNTGLHLITPLKKNMKNKLLLLWDKLMLRRRSLIETVNDQLKNEMCIDHTRHRSPMNFMVNLISGLIAYTFKKKKPCINYCSKTSAMAVV